MSETPTLRDYFAGKALQGIMSNWEMWLAMMQDRKNVPAFEYVAKDAYEMADEMVKARKTR